MPFTFTCLQSADGFYSLFFFLFDKMEENTMKYTYNNMDGEIHKTYYIHYPVVT